MFTQKRHTRVNWLGLTILFLAFCGSIFGNTMSANAQLWEGASRGYVALGDPAVMMWFSSFAWAMCKPLLGAWGLMIKKTGCPIHLRLKY